MQTKYTDSTFLLNTTAACSEWLMKEHRIDGEGEMSVANTNNMILSKEKSVIVNMVTSPQTSLLPVYISGY